MIGRIFLAATVLMLPVVPAAAHDDYDRHARDHAKHSQYHRWAGRAHERAHADGFDSYREHRAYHRALREFHREFHADHPNTRHDHYWWRRD